MTPALESVARVSAGIGLWAVHFGVLYGSTALACARGYASLGAQVGAWATLVAAGLAAAIVLREWPRRERFESWLAVTIAALAFLAIVFEGVALLLAPQCVSS
jgi:hypothetical protein